MKQLLNSVWKFFLSHVVLLFFTALGLLLLTAFFAFWNENRKMQQIVALSIAGDVEAVLVCRYPDYEDLLEEYGIWLFHDLSEVWVRDPQQATLFRGQKKIQNLGVRGIQMTPDLLENFEASKSIKELILYEATWAGGTSLSLYPEVTGLFQKLENVNLAYSKLDFDSLSAMSQSASLDVVHLFKTKIQGEYQGKRCFPHAQRIFASQTTGDIFSLISGAEKVKSVAILSSDYEPENMHLLLGLGHVETLLLMGNNHLTEECLENLREYANRSGKNLLAGSLKDLRISSDHLTGNSVELLEELFPHLEELLVVSEKISLNDFIKYSTRSRNTIALNRRYSQWVEYVRLVKDAEEAEWQRLFNSLMVRYFSSI